MTDADAMPARSSARERLLHATLEVIDEVGVANATTRRIAERAGVNLQLIQYHFGGGVYIALDEQAIHRYESSEDEIMSFLGSIPGHEWLTGRG